MTAPHPDTKPDWALTARERTNQQRQADGKPPLPKRRWPWYLCGVVLLAGGAWYATHLPQVAPTAQEPVASAPMRMEINPQERMEVTIGPVARTLRITGTLHPVDTIGVSGPVGGRVDSVLVRVGERVKQGDVLVRLDPEPLERARNSQRATVAATQAQMTLAQTQRDRTRALVARGGSTQAALEQAEAEYAALEAQLEGQRETLAAAEFDRANTTITAPISGTITTRDANPGTTIASGSTVATIADLHAVDFEATVPLAYVGQIAVGQTVRITADGAQHDHTGTVARINPVADAQSRATSVFITVPNPDGALLGGMYAVGQITIDHQEGTLVPEEAVRTDAQEPYVLVVRNQILERQTVATTLDWSERSTLIHSGLETGDVILTAALPELVAGDSVALVD